MFVYEKKLQYPVRIANPNPKLAAFIISQYGGPDGELGASLRYLSQRYSMPYPELKALLTDIGKKYGKTPAQVVLRWNTQRGVVIIPKSTHKERMEQNLDIWDFTLSAEDMAAIGQLDLGHSEIIDHSAAETAKWLNGWKIHD